MVSLIVLRPVPHYHFDVIKLTQYHVVLGDSLTPVYPVEGNLFDGLFANRPHPYAEVGGHHVHHTETGQKLELVNVQLKEERNGKIRIQ